MSKVTTKTATKKASAKTSTKATTKKPVAKKPKMGIHVKNLYDAMKIVEEHFNAPEKKTNIKLTEQQKKIIAVFEKHSFGCQRDQVVDLVSAMVGFDFGQQIKTKQENDVNFGRFHHDKQDDRIIFPVAVDGDGDLRGLIFYLDDKSVEGSYYDVRDLDVEIQTWTVDEFFAKYANFLTSSICIHALSELVDECGRVPELLAKLGL